VAPEKIDKYLEKNVFWLINDRQDYSQVLLWFFSTTLWLVNSVAKSLALMVSVGRKSANGLPAGTSGRWKGLSAFTQGVATGLN
jgi:hypothetical protein